MQGQHEGAPRERPCRLLPRDEARFITAGPEGVSPWERVAPRTMDPERWRRFQAYVAEIFEALGMDLETPGAVRTPERFLRALFDSTSGYEGDPKLITVFPTECREEASCALSQIIEGPIPFFSLCEHHGFPFHGVAHVGYIADETIIGISKLTRLVRLFARRFTVQERVGNQIADTLLELLEPHGVAVHLEAVHLCVRMRGIFQDQSKTRTSFWRGSYESEPSLREEFLGACRRDQR